MLYLFKGVCALNEILMTKYPTFHVKIKMKNNMFLQKLKHGKISNWN